MTPTTLPRYSLYSYCILLFILIVLTTQIILGANSTQSFSFKLPEHFASKDASNAGCCEFGGIPLPAGRDRKKPFLIGLGVHKSGTSYLFNMLKLHPKFRAPLTVKELLMFGQWPVSDLAFDAYLNAWGNVSDPNIYLYEMTATYLHTPGAACRIKQLVPHARFVVVLRDPVPRALSHWNMQETLFRKGSVAWKPTPFPELIAREIKIMQQLGCTFNRGRPEKDWNDCFKCWYVVTDEHKRNQLCSEFSQKFAGDTPCNPKMTSGMFTPFGIYAAPIAWWLTFFQPEQFLFVNNEELAQDPVTVGNRLLAFLGEEPIFTEEMLEEKSSWLDPNTFGYVVSKDDPLIAKTLHLLKDFYEPTIRDLYRLFDLLGVDFTPFKDWPDYQLRLRL